MRVGITGHQHLKAAAQWPFVRDAINTILDGFDTTLVGVSCLAVGADQLFARIVLERGGLLYAVIPFSDYERTFHSIEDRHKYMTLVAKASQVEVLKETEGDERAFLAAGRRVVEICDVVIAVWNGKPAIGLGGTADIVKYARTSGRDVRHINPELL